MREYDNRGRFDRIEVQGYASWRRSDLHFYKEMYDKIDQYKIPLKEVLELGDDFKGD